MRPLQAQLKIWPQGARELCLHNGAATDPYLFLRRVWGAGYEASSYGPRGVRALGRGKLSNLSLRVTSLWLDRNASDLHRAWEVLRGEEELELHFTPAVLPQPHLLMAKRENSRTVTVSPASLSFSVSLRTRDYGRGQDTWHMSVGHPLSSTLDGLVLSRLTEDQVVGELSDLFTDMYGVLDVEAVLPWLRRSLARVALLAGDRDAWPRTSFVWTVDPETLEER